MAWRAAADYAADESRRLGAMWVKRLPISGGYRSFMVDDRMDAEINPIVTDGPVTLTEKSRLSSGPYALTKVTVQHVRLVGGRDKFAGRDRTRR
jgi:hypothetical protein